MELERYSRQARFSPIGDKGQSALLQSSAIVLGCGALGSVSAELLARAGVGDLTLIDRDYVELSNLQRQTLFDEQDAAESLPKAIAAERRLRRINSGIQVHGIVEDLRPRNAMELLSGADVIVDATDNFESRYLINDFAIARGVPWIYGAAVGSYGIVMPIIPNETPCFRCIYPDSPKGAQPTCETAGVLNTVTSVVASLQATIALQILSGNREAVRRKVTTVDVWTGPLREFDQADRDPDCACCGRGEYDWLNGLHDSPVSLCGRNAVQIHACSGAIDLGALRDRLRDFGQVRATEFALQFAKDPYQITVFADGRAIIKGTTDVGVARSLYARWISA